jgi:hypothetical protein
MPILRRWASRRRRASEHGGQLWIARPARGSDDKRRTPSIVNGRPSVSTFPALPARWSAEIVESNVDFSVKSPACHAEGRGFEPRRSPP